MKTCYLIERPHLGKLTIKFGYYVRSNMFSNNAVWIFSLSSWLRNLERNKIWCIKFNAAKSEQTENLITTSNSGAKTFNFDATMLIKDDDNKKDIKKLSYKMAGSFDVYLNDGKIISFLNFGSGNYTALDAAIFQELLQ